MDRDDFTDQQADAVGTLSRNYPVTAGAGTGKTTTLSFRYLELLSEHPDLLPENVLVTTFTRRAARDLTQSVRERVLDRLADADADHDRWRAVLDGLDDAYVHTLHAFCQRVLSEHATAVPGLDPGFDTLDEVEASRLQRSVVEELLEAEPREVTLLRDRFSAYSLRELLTDLFGERPDSETWADVWSDPGRSVEEYVAHVAEELHPFPPEEADALWNDEDLRATVAELSEFTDGMDRRDAGNRTERVWTAVELFDAPSEADESDDADGEDGAESTRDRRQRLYDACDALTKSDHGEYTDYTPTKGDWSGTEDDRERVGELVADVVDGLDATRRSAEADGLDAEADRRGAPYVFALARLFDEAARRYRERKAERNALDYTDLVRRTRDLLDPERGNAAVRESLADRFEFVMIDEVQDTDPNQWDIVRALTSLAGEDGPYGARNVFAVGDEKQSIYRFRNADVAVFQEARSALVGANSDGESDSATEGSRETTESDSVVGHQLQDNFRTLPPVLRFLNSLFEDVFDGGSADPFEAAPQPLRPKRDDPEGIDPTIEYLLVPDDDLRESVLPVDHPFGDGPPSSRRWTEAQSVAARVTRLVESGTEVYDPEADGDPEARPVTYDDVAVIIRKRTHLDEFKRAFDDHDVPYTVVEGEGYFDAPEVRTLRNLFRVLADPRDDVRLFGLLRSPMFGITDDALAPLVEGGDAWESIADADDEAVSQAHALLSELRELAGETDERVGPRVDSWAELLDVAIDATGYLVSVSADERPRQARANVERFEEYLRDAVDDAGNLREVVRRLDDRKELSSHDPEAAVPDGETGVEILTVHAAKGEEFPVVVVPGVGDEFNTDPPLAGGTEFEAVNGRPALGMAVPDGEDPFDTADTVAKKGLRARRLEKLRAEEKRTLYVACTRARDHLILAGTHASEDGESLSNVEEPETDEPRRWRDFVQESLLGDESLLATVEAEGTATGRLRADELTRAEGSDPDRPSYAVRLPPRPVDRTGDADEATPPTDVEIPSPDARPVEYRLSPSQIADVLSDRPDGELAFDESARVVRYRRSDDEGDEAGDGGDRGIEAGDGGSDNRPHGSVWGKYFGEAVHRICELQLPAERWDAVIDDALGSMGYDGPVTEDDRDRIAEHARRGNAHVSRIAGDGDAVYRELDAGVELEHGRVSGVLDCLVVGEDSATVVDYKTGAVEASELDRKAADYRPQLEAYALMVAAFDSDRPVETRLYFTEVEESRDAAFGTDGGKPLGELRTDLDRRLCEAVASQTGVSLGRGEEH